MFLILKSVMFTYFTFSVPFILRWVGSSDNCKLPSVEVIELETLKGRIKCFYPQKIR